MSPQSNENAPPSSVFQQLPDGTPDMSQLPKENTPPQRALCMSPSLEDQLLKNPEQEDLKGTVGISIYPFMPNFH
jgi:hypothetical protein